jgi:fluoroacetyl-CoA thioesterase
MKGRPKIGADAELRFTVTIEHAIDFARDGMPAVLSTPSLVSFLERTAREVMLPLLEPNERTVGIEIEVRHLAPTPVGQSVTCTARVIQVEGLQATFQVEARDEQEVIARGLHKRQVIRVEPFAQRVARKARVASP